MRIDWDFLKEALTHSSVRKDRSDTAFNWELEFLGDAVLRYIVTLELTKVHPSTVPKDRYVEWLDEARTMFVGHLTLVEVGTDIKVRERLIIGNSIEGGREGITPNMIEGAVEAIIGAYYREKGLRTARKWILQYVMTDKRMKKALTLELPSQKAKRISALAITPIS